MTGEQQLFSNNSDPGNNNHELDPQAPLAHRMRPRNFDEFVGQQHALGADKPLRRALQADRLSSLILHGPPGCGKTALAHIIARHTEASFERLNAVLAGKDDLREVIERARTRLEHQDKQTLLFFDEIHRFNKAQQDALLPSVENGTLILFGATTQNPSFYLNNALLSRSLLVEFKPLEFEQLEILLDRALTDEERGIQNEIELTEEARKHLIESSGGDARRLFNGLEIAARTAETGDKIDLQQVEGAIQDSAVNYDKNADHHYNVASAFIKSIRGSDPDAAIYYLAKMLEAGEDPLFIARRLVIAASEDIGNAAPYGLTLAISAQQAVEFVGLPEAQIPLAQATAYLASSPKSNAAYKAISEAREKIKNGLNLPVPDHLRDPRAARSSDDNATDEYKYPHDYPGHYTPQSYLPEDLSFYQPTKQGQEARLKKYLAKIRENNN
ncbi:MAG: replication-associated recombination protein A [bacterium]